MTVLFGVLSLDAQDLPLDPALRKGVLDNGLTYYIRHNEEPKERASFYIIQNVGALLENDDQNGLAHFLEHMAFNGTENFKGKGIINVLQRNGVEFGRNLNAYTALDETVYNISEVPTTREGLMDTCLLILHDWCNYLLLTEEEIDAERGVITEEWRTRNSAQSRMRNKSVNYMMRGSKYTERDVIGSLNVIKNFDPKALRDFYHDWYRTDLQAIAVVGDFDVDEMETKIKQRFSTIPAVENPPHRYYVEVPHNIEPIYGLVTDKEATNTSVSVSFKHQSVPRSQRGEAYYRTTIIRSLYAQMFSQRIKEITQKEDAPFVWANSAYNEIVHGLDMYRIEAVPQKNEEAKALEAIMTENERVKRHGFTPSELERAKKDFFTFFESAYKQRDKISNDKLAREYARNYLKGEAVPGIAYEFELVKKHLPGISIEEINTSADQWISYDGMVVLISGPENLEHLSEEQAFGIIDKVRKTEVAPYVDEVVSTSLLSPIPQGTKIKETRLLPTLGAEEWILGNGVKVIYRFSDIEKDRVYVNAYSKGGTSLYDVENLPSAQMAKLVNSFGLGDYDMMMLNKMLSGKHIELSPHIGELTEGISAKSTYKDIETLFQILYMSFEQPRFDESIFKSTMAQYSTFLENQKNSPQRLIRDSILMINTAYHPRTILLDEDYLQQVSLEKIERIYRERFADANDFTFIVTGNILKEEAQPMVETYLGALSVKDGEETWVDHEINMPKGETKKEIYIPMETPKSTVSIKYGDAKMTYTPEHLLYAKLLADILDLRYMEKVREEEGGTYGVRVSCAINEFPESTASLSIRFDCDPEKVKDLTPIIYEELELIAKHGPGSSDLDKVLVIANENREQAFEKNNFWISAMRRYELSGMDIVSPSYHEDIVKRIRPEDIKHFAKKLLKKSSHTELVFLPQK